MVQLSKQGYVSERTNQAHFMSCDVRAGLRSALRTDILWLFFVFTWPVRLSQTVLQVQKKLVRILSQSEPLLRQGIRLIRAGGVIKMQKNLSSSTHAVPSHSILTFVCLCRCFDRAEERGSTLNCVQIQDHHNTVVLKGPYTHVHVDEANQARQEKKLSPNFSQSRCCR